jgi:hypothetical protein
LITRGTEHLEPFLERYERVGRVDVTPRLRRGRLESPRGLDQLGCGLTEVFSRLHAAIIAASNES